MNSCDIRTILSLFLCVFTTRNELFTSDPIVFSVMVLDKMPVEDTS